MKYDTSFLLPIEKGYLEGLLTKVSKLTSISKERIKSQTRAREVVVARHLYCYMAIKLRNFDLSSGKIGSLIDRDHAAVLHGVKKINHDIDSNYKPTVNFLEILGLLKVNYEEYTILWEMPSLISVLKTGRPLDFNLILERSTKM